ncbi:NAD(P)-dependent oxidoreductase [Rhizobacter sp. J219]|jgi:3-hydroxyisobutyrate dehydrogenase-like beta-hydroxyacid dehydrogenase|uniref:NAD(P)-dependent oxidoreductase n=1 Tax=Rhizobacter sp. J219 TaxID=2898430 RepID=UPI0021515FDA|nr:NAD(P)-dependent oxidoreductase [Rhizobacter sp. J219]MCR5884676.1 NAD(P)-dependent oxidoreductase [Rhizobacter sp. J219]
MTSSPASIGFIGLGMMGHGIAKNLLKKGHPLRFKAHRNRSTLQDLLDAGAVEVDTRAALAQADIVILCVTGSPQVEEIVYGADGLLAAARPGLIVVDTSTAEPASSTRIRHDFAAKGTKFIDAPLARTPKEAEEGRLNTMVGAADADFETLRPVFAAFCENIIHVGPPGHGHVLKLVNNMLAMSMAASIAEAMAAAAKAGLSLQKVFDVVSAGGVNSGIFQMMVGRALQGDLTGLKFAIGNAQKDLRYYTHLTETLPTVSFMAEAAHQTFVQAANLGYGDKFIASLLEVQEKVSDVKFVPR